METDEKLKLGQSKLHWADIVVIGMYFLVVLAVGLWSSRRSAKGSISGYFLASRNMHWIPVGASLFASNIGSGHFVGLAGSAAASGIGIAFFEIHGAFMLILLGWIFVPVYMASGVYTMPEYLQKRFGGQRIRIYLSVLSLILYVFTKISADLFAGAIFIEQALGWNLYLAIILLLSVAAIFTIAGGLTAVMWTDFVQTILMVIGSFILMIISLIAVGGYDSIWSKYLEAEANNSTFDDLTNTSCEQIPPDSLHLFRSIYSTDLPWTGVIFGLTISATWYWCTDQVIVQRALAAKNISHAKAGTIFAGYLKILPLFVLVFPGMISRILYTEEVGCATSEKCLEVCGNPRGCTNIAYPLLVIRLMPIGLSGMMLAVMLAALMSSLTSIFNSSSTIFTMDIWTRIRPNAKEWELLIVGRLFVLALIVVSILWIPVIKASRGSQLFVYIQSITSYLAPPVCAVYVLAVLYSRINEHGAFWGLMIGLIVGLTRFAFEFIYTAPVCGSGEIDSRPAIIIDLIGRVHYLHFGLMLFFFCVIITTIISLCTQPIDSIYMHRLTFWSRKSRQPRLDINFKEDRNRVTETNIKHLPISTISSNTLDDLEDIKIYGIKPNGPNINESHMPGELDIRSHCSLSIPWKRIIYVFCGIQTSKQANEQPKEPEKSPVEEAESAVEYIKETTAWKWGSNINALLLIAATLVVCIYYA